MPRKPVIRSSEFPYHVYARCNNKDWFALPLSKVWEIYCEVFAMAAEKYDLRVSAFVLMANHFHCFIYTPHANIDEIMMYVMRQSSLRIGAVTGRINKIYGGRYKSTLLRNSACHALVLRYIYRNPVKAGICKQVESYPFSTVVHHSGFPISIPENLVLMPGQRLEFFNVSENRDVEIAIRASLKKSELLAIKSRATRRVLAG